MIAQPSHDLWTTAADPAMRRFDSSWDYAGEATKSLTHGLHPYPAMMIPQVAHRLIATYSSPEHTVLDPFCGAGSVLVEARALGRAAVGVDLNPLATLIARVKTTPLADSAIAIGARQIESALPSLLADPPPPPPAPRLSFWFKPTAMRALSALRAAIRQIPAPQTRAFFEVAFSETARRASNTRVGEYKLYRYEPAALAAHNPDVLALFWTAVARNREAMRRFSRACPPEGSVTVRDADSRRPLPLRGPVDVIVSSPPYGDSRTTVAYGQFSRLSAQWLGLHRGGDLDTALLGGSGSTTTLRSPTAQVAIAAIAEDDPVRARAVARYYADLAECLVQASSVLRPGGYACWVVGNRRVAGHQLPTDLIVAELGAPIGLITRDIIVRRIPTKRLPSRNSPSNVRGVTAETMSHEYIVVQQKGDRVVTAA